MFDSALGGVLVAGLLAALAGGALTGVVRRFALRRSLLDIPNERSSHSVPTPRGGGLAIALVSLSAVAWAGWTGGIEAGEAIGLAGGGLLVAAAGWVDDVRPLRASVRGLMQTVAAAWFLCWIGGLPALRLGESIVPLGPLGWAAALIGIVWSINLYNFMDGIDGLAGGQAVIAGGIGAVLLAVAGLPGLGLVVAAMAGSSLGFLSWNWSPARIFMGDVGSGLLGFCFGAIAVLSERDGGPPLMVWMLLGGVFLFDATATVLRRMARGERWYAAHRCHAYQRATLLGWSHARVSTVAMLLALFCGGLASLAWYRPEAMLPAAAIAVASLASVYLWLERRLPMFRRAGGAPAAGLDGR